MKKILILFSHPALEKSRINKKLVNRINKVEGITFHDLYENYPKFDINIEREKELLLAHDIVIFQHPFFWYSCPPLLKQWIDLVLEHGWAYGSKGTALAGKWGLNVITTGGGEQAYAKEGMNRHTIREFLAPFRQTFSLCKMIPLPPFVVHGTHRLEGEEIDKYAESYVYIVESLRDDKFDLATLQNARYLNDLSVKEVEG